MRYITITKFVSDISSNCELNASILYRTREEILMATCIFLSSFLCFQRYRGKSRRIAVSWYVGASMQHGVFNVLKI